MTRLPFIKARLLSPPPNTIGSILWISAALATSTAIQWLLISQREAQAPFFIYEVAVLLTATLVGTKQAAVVALASMLLANYLFTEPRFVLFFGPSDTIPALIYLVACVIIIIFASTLRRTVRALEQSREHEAELNSRLSTIMRVTPAITVVVRSPDLRVVYVSPFLSKILGVSSEELQDIPFDSFEAAVRVFYPDGRPLERDERLVVRAARGETIVEHEGELLAGPDGELVPLLCNADPIRDEHGKVIGGALACFDVRSLKTLEAELRGAYRELAHRVKNHLQIMSGLIAIDARDPAITAAELADRNQFRLETLAKIYDTMVKSEVGAKVRALEFIDTLCQPYRSPAVAIQVSVEPGDVLISTEQASHLGMLVNEAVCNSYKHAFPNGVGTVWVSLKRVGRDQMELEIADDGIGLPAASSKSRSHGLLVMRDQAEKLKASFEVTSRPTGGAAVRARMPAELQASPSI